MRNRIVSASLIVIFSVIVAGIGIRKKPVSGEEKVTTPSAVSSFGTVTGSVVSEPAIAMPSPTLAVEPFISPSPSPKPSKPPKVTLKKVSKLRVKKAKSLKKVTLRWKSVKHADSYIIYRKKGKGALAVLTKTRKTAYVDKKVKPGAAYTYAVRARRKSQAGENIKGALSDKRQVELTPPAVKGLRSSAQSGAVILNWKKQKNVTGYQVYMKVFVHLKGVKTKYNHMVNTKAAHYRKGMLVRGMKYGFLVRAYKQIGKRKVYSGFMKVVQRAG